MDISFLNDAGAVAKNFNMAILEEGVSTFNPNVRIPIMEQWFF